jgi:hypothetical protein
MISTAGGIKQDQAQAETPDRELPEAVAAR